MAGSQQSLFEAQNRNDNGVRVRADGKGDSWANAHRLCLPRQFYIQDVDAIFGFEAFGHNTGERLFLEYAPDNYDQNARRIRKFGIVAMFDRKVTLELALSPRNSVSAALYLFVCRTFGRPDVQPIVPKFFYVVGGAEPPWRMHEVNIETAEVEEMPFTLEGQDWREVWRAAGLAQIRQSLLEWLGS